MKSKKWRFYFQTKPGIKKINHLFPVFLPRSRTRAGLKAQWQLELHWLQQEAWNGGKKNRLQMNRIITSFFLKVRWECVLPEVWQKHQRAPQRWQVSELCLLLRDQRQNQLWDSWLIWSAAGLLMAKNPAGKKKKKTYFMVHRRK